MCVMLLNVCHMYTYVYNTIKMWDVADIMYLASVKVLIYAGYIADLTVGLTTFYYLMPCS